MTKEEYRTHLLEVIKMIAAAENPNVTDKLRRQLKIISTLCPDEILNIPDDSIIL